MKLNPTGKKFRRYSKRKVDRHAIVDKVAFKYIMWSWKLDDVKRSGLNTLQWASSHLMKLGLTEDIDRITRGEKDYLIAPKVELLEHCPELKT
jgi:hypothetical protein